MKKLRFLFVLSSLMLICACEKEDPESLAPLDMTQNGSAVLKSGVPVIETPLEFTGITRFTAYSVHEKRYIKSPDEGGPNVTAILTHKQGHEYLLGTTETIPFPPFFTFRVMEIHVKITPGGVVTFSWPEEWEQINSFADPTLTPHTDMIEQVKADMGYVIKGPGINKGTLIYKGYFDGERLFAASNFMGKQVQPGTFIPWFTEIVDGPIKVEFFIDLTVAD